MEVKKILNESHDFRFFREFATNTAFLAFPLISEVVFSGIGKLFTPIHIFLLFGLFFQTFLIVNAKNQSFFKIFILNIITPFLYLLIEFIDEGVIVGNYIYIFYFFYTLINGIFRGFEFYFSKNNKKYNLYLNSLDIFIKILIIPIFYFLLKYSSNTSLDFFSFYLFSENTHTFLLFIFIYLSIIFSLDIYLSEKRKYILDDLLLVLHKYSSYIVDSNDLEESIKTGEIISYSKKIYKAVIFMDIRGFTSWSENNKPEEVIKLLNGFYTVAEDLIVLHNGKINKYVADEILFIFDDLDEAINFALDLKIKEIDYLDKFGLKVGLGINAGVLIYGWIGGDNKKEQTVIGDVVNVAARLEGGLNQIRMLKSIVPNRYVINDLGTLNLKGKSKDMEIVEIVSKK